MASAREFGLEVVRTSGGEELVQCPFHEDTNPSAWFNPKKELFYCAVCGVGYNAVQLARRLGVEVERQDEEWGKEPEDYNMVEEEVDYDLGMDVYNDYFRERGIREESIREYGVRWSVALRAAVFPFLNAHNQLVGVSYRFEAADWRGRYRTQGKPTPVWPMQRLVGGVDPEKTLLITEGPFSALKLHTFGVKYGFNLATFALFGAKSNQEIVDLLNPYRCVFLYDGDKAGTRACKEMKKRFPNAYSCTLSVSPDDMDDEMMSLMWVKLWDKIGRE